MDDKERYFKKVYNENKDKIYRLCLGFVGNKFDADDLLQEISIKIWDNLETFKGNSNISTWVYRIATNTAILFSKKRSKKYLNQTSLFPEEIQGEPAEPDIAEKEHQTIKLYETIATLKEMDRIIITLVLEGKSYKGIASITGLNLSNVGVRINRIKKSLTQKLK